MLVRPRIAAGLLDETMLMTSGSASYHRRTLARPPRFEFGREYVARLVAGDVATERHFTRYFGELLSAKLRARMRSPEVVEDLKQETFARVLSSLRQKGGLVTPESLGAYVSSVCRNVLFEQYRAQARGTGEPLVPDGRPDKADSAPSGEAGMIVRDERRTVREVLAEMSEQDQVLLRGLFYEECDKDELCRRVGVDRDYLRVLVHRAKARFRAEFEGKVEDP